MELRFRLSISLVRSDTAIAHAGKTFIWQFATLRVFNFVCYKYARILLEDSCEKSEKLLSLIFSERMRLEL